MNLNAGKDDDPKKTTAPAIPKSSQATKKSRPSQTIVQFYSKSKDANDLGQLGYGTAIDKKLQNVPHWRKVLSNFYESEIEVDQERYPSVEHYFHAMKARHCSDRPAYAVEFQVGQSIGRKSPLEAKRAGGRAGFAKVNATLNVSKWIAQRDEFVTKALLARAKSDSLFVQVLLATKQRNLYLLHYERGGSKSYWGGSISRATGKQVGTNRLGKMLMELRDQLDTPSLVLPKDESDMKRVPDK